jgi:hypothetical protein
MVFTDCRYTVRNCKQPIHVAGTVYSLYIHTVPEQCTAVHGAEVQLIDGRRSFLLPVRGTGTAYSQYTEYMVPELYSMCSWQLEHAGRVYNALSALMLLKLQYSNNRSHCLCIPPCLLQRICGLYDSTGRSNTLCTNANLNM